MTEAGVAEPVLDGIKVLNLTRVLAGPWCTQILADLGADVIKVEWPGAGDDTRGWGPPFVKDADGRETGQSTYFTACNRNKRSLTVDMDRPEGRALLHRLAAESDVLVENFKVGGLRRHGLDHECLCAAHPRLVYCSVTGRPDGEPGAGPLRVGVAFIDLFTGVYASTAILAALRTRDRTGQGQHIDMSLLDVGMAVLANQASAFLNGGTVPGRIRQCPSKPRTVPGRTHARWGHAACDRQ